MSIECGERDHAQTSGDLGSREANEPNRPRSLDEFRGRVVPGPDPANSVSTQAKDKAERRARGGKLAGKLSADGYNPSIDQSDARRDAALPADAAADEAKAADRVDVAQLANGKVVSETAPPPPTLDPPAAVDKAIATLQKCVFGGGARPARPKAAA